MVASEEEKTVDSKYRGTAEQDEQNKATRAECKSSDWWRQENTE
jgi:hypothetical protein